MLELEMRWRQGARNFISPTPITVIDVTDIAEEAGLASGVSLILPRESFDSRHTRLRSRYRARVSRSNLHATRRRQARKLKRTISLCHLEERLGS